MQIPPRNFGVYPVSLKIVWRQSEFAFFVRQPSVVALFNLWEFERSVFPKKCNQNTKERSDKT